MRQNGATDEPPPARVEHDRPTNLWLEEEDAIDPVVGCAWLYVTTFCPANAPRNAPSAMSLAQCSSRYRRASPGIAAPA